MRCIEMSPWQRWELVSDRINSNMRCIEIVWNILNEDIVSKINSNMRCIEMKEFAYIKSAEDLDKQ